MSAKIALRREAEENRRQLVRPDFAARLATHVAALPLAVGAAVSGYAAFRDEADPKLLLLALAARGHPLALPVIVAKGEALRFAQWQPDDVLITHAYGVQEPQPAAAMVSPDLLLVPLLAFDAAGYRLGYGGGYYDRTLSALRAQKPVIAIGIAYAGQQVTAVPHDAHDQRLDGILTEEGLRISDPA